MENLYLLILGFFVLVELYIIYHLWTKLRERTLDSERTYNNIIRSGFSEYRMLGIEMIYAIIHVAAKKNNKLDNFHRGKIHEKAEDYYINKMENSFNLENPLSVLVMNIIDYLQNQVVTANKEDMAEIQKFFGRGKVLLEKFESALNRDRTFVNIDTIIAAKYVIDHASLELKDFIKEIGGNLD